MAVYDETPTISVNIDSPLIDAIKKHSGFKVLVTARNFLFKVTSRGKTRA